RENGHQYPYGHKLCLSGSLRYTVVLNDKIGDRPSIGMLHEPQHSDHTMGYKIQETGGGNTNDNAGLEANIKNIAFGFTYQTPASQHITQGRTEFINKYLTHITYTF